MKRIVIEGDSWAYFWDLNPDGTATARPGIGSMLEGFEVRSQAEPGSSNDQVLSRLQKSVDDWDLAIVFLTEQIRRWLTVEAPGPGSNRQWRMAIDLAPFTARVKELGSLDLLMRSELRQYFSAVDALGKPVWFLGGCSLVPEELLLGLDNLRSPIASVVELLLPGCKDCIYQDTYQWQSREYADWVISQGDIGLIKEWYEITARTRDKTDSWQDDKQYFFPDKWHPNEQGHRKIAEVLGPLLREHFDQTRI